MKTTPSNPVFRVACLLFALFLAAFAAGPLHAQTLPAATAAPAKVGTITIKFVSPGNVVSEQFVRANMQLKEGMDFDDTLVDRDIRSLNKTGHFEFIEIKREERADHTVDLTVEVTPKARVKEIRYEGNTYVKASKLDGEIKTKPNTPLDEHQVNEDAGKIREYYQKAGYNQVKVDKEIVKDPKTGLGTVTFRIVEGNKVHISDILFVGNDHIKAAKLRDQMETKKWWIFSWLTGSGRLKDEDFDDDLDKLRDFYRESGYLDVEILREKVTFAYPSSSRLIITIPVQEGRQYKIGEITITGNTLVTTEVLRSRIKQKSGMIFAPSKLDKDVEALEDAFGVGGYFETRVRLVRKPNLSTGNIDIEYAVTESEKLSVESIRIEGNSKTKSTVILRELSLGPGDVFDSVKMKNSRQRLENTHFFDDVNMAPESTNIPGRRNLKISVKEARTGDLQFGAGYSSLERAVIFAEIKQSNFDLFNRRSMFQGAGQKFRIRVQLGTNSSEAILSFEEPWLFERELALGFNLYRTSQNYTNTLYNEIRTGGEVYVRKYLFELVEARLGYTYEVVTIDNVVSTASPLYQSLAGTQSVSKLTLQISRDTRDKLLNTTSGNRVEADIELAGGPLSGDTNYYRLETRGAQFWPIFDTQGQVFSVIGRAGVIDNYGKSSDVPFFDRYFLGGPYTLRGFEYQGVGPKDSVGEPIGGKTYGFFSLEYSLDIVSPVRFAAFYDAGFVNANAYDFSPAHYNDNFGFGLRLFVAGAPLNLDFGFPLRGDAVNKKGMQFNFSFGTRF